MKSLKKEFHPSAVRLGMINKVNLDLKIAPLYKLCSLQIANYAFLLIRRSFK